MQWIQRRKLHQAERQDPERLAANAVWHVVRGSGANSVAGRSRPDRGVPQLSGARQVSIMAEHNLNGLNEISGAVRSLLAEEETECAPEARAAFAPVHSRLMNAIDQSRRYEMPVLTPGVDELASTGLDTAPVRRRFRLSLPWPRYRQTWAAAMVLALIFVAGLGGHQIARQGTADVFPVQCLADDFDAGLKSPTPYEFVSHDPEATAQWLSAQLGMPVRLPSPERAGVKLVGARRHVLRGRPVAQTHYIKDGQRVALYQVLAPKYGFSGLNEVRGNGRRHFFYKDCGGYRVVLWRSGENVMAIVTPVAIHEALQLATAIRENSPHHSAGGEP